MAPPATATPVRGNAPAVLLVGFDAATARKLGTSLGPGVEVLVAASGEEAQALLAVRDVAVLCLGSEVAGLRAQELLRGVAASRRGGDLRTLVLAAETPDLFADAMGGDEVYYLSRHVPPTADVEALLAGALAAHRASRPAMAVPEDAPAVETQATLDAIRRVVSATSVEAAASAAAQAVKCLLAVERACCRLYDAASETLWYEDTGAVRRHSAARGLVSFVGRTGRALRVERLGEDPRYDAEADNPGGDPRQRFLAVAVAGRDTGLALAVLVALRAPEEAPFSGAELDRLCAFADEVAPVFRRLVPGPGVDGGVASGTAGAGSHDLRQEVAARSARGLSQHGGVLQISPRWTRWTYRLLLAVFVAGLFYLVSGSVHEYAAGPAVVRVAGRTDVTARRAGTVTRVEVEPGQRVAAGDLLVGFDGRQEGAELERLEGELESARLERMRQPSDPSRVLALETLSAQKQLAQARLEELSVRAPHAGTVGDVRIRVGQHLLPGDVILSLLGDDPRLHIVAFLPGHYRPQIHPGMPLRLELQGYRYAYQHLEIERIGDRVVGVAEARRLLGAGSGEALSLPPSVVLVEANLDSETFESGGETYRYYDGSLATAEVRVRSERILFALLPGLKAAFADRHE